MKKFLIISATLIFAIITGCEPSENSSTITQSPTTTLTPATSSNNIVTPSVTVEVGKDALRLEPMTYQLSQDQVKAMFGNNCHEATSRESGGKLWHYDIEPKPEYKPVNNAVYDAVGLKSGTIKGQVWVTWGIDGKLISITSYYLKDGEIIESSINESELKKAYSEKKRFVNNQPGNDVRNPMTFQLSQDQIKGMFGHNYTEVIDAMTGEWKVWRYDIQPISGYKSDYDIYKNGVIDESGLNSQAIKAQVFVTWDPNGKLISLDCHYLQNGSITHFGLNEYNLIQTYGGN